MADGETCEDLTYNWDVLFTVKGKRKLGNYRIVQSKLLVFVLCSKVLKNLGVNSSVV